MTMTVTQVPSLETDRGSGRIGADYIYHTHPDVDKCRSSQRIFVQIERLHKLIDLLMPLDGKPLGSRITAWCVEHYETAEREWWPPVTADEF